MSDFNLGTVTAYGYAKDKGYTGTEDDFAALMASYADVAEQAAESAEQAAASATTATAKASEAAQSATAAASSKTAAETAQGGAETAAQTATTKAGEASTAATTATNKAIEATTAATTATGKATEAAGSATTATTKAGEASTSATNAAASATRAQEILDSIPEDYSQLSEDVSGLKDGLKPYYTLNDFAFSYGGIYNGSINTDHTRIHSDKMIHVFSGMHIKFKDSYNGLWIASYNPNGTYKANGTWTKDFSVNFDGYVRVVLCKPSNVTIAESEFTGLIDKVEFLYDAVAVFDKLLGDTDSNTAKTSVTEGIMDEYGIYDAKNSANIGISNLFDKDASGVTTNGYYDRTNTFVSNSSLGSSDYIRVFQGFEYYTNLNAGFFVLWFDSNKTFLTYTNVSGANVKFSPVTDAVYMRTLLMLNSIDTYTVKCDRIFASLASESPYADLNGVAFGTSLTYRAQSTGGYLQYLPSLCGANIENKGLGNSTILDNGSNPKMMDVITGYTGYASKDFAILEGFVNDWYNNAASLGTWKDTGTTTVCGCVRTALTHILTQNPSITLILVIDPVGKSSSGVDCSSLATRNGLTQTEFYDEVAKVADTLGIPTVRVDRNGGMSELTPYMYIDNIHPTAEGAEQTANTIWSIMKNIPIKVVDA